MELANHSEAEPLIAPAAMERGSVLTVAGHPGVVQHRDLHHLDNQEVQASLLSGNQRGLVARRLEDLVPNLVLARALTGPLVLEGNLVLARELTGPLVLEGNLVLARALTGPLVLEGNLVLAQADSALNTELARD